MSSRAGHCLRQTARYPALRCARRHAGRRVELPPPPRATPVNRRLSGAAAAAEPAAEPSPPPAVVWEGPKLEQIPRGSFFSFLREYGQWERAAEQPALSCSTTGRTLTFRDLERRVASAAAALAREGFGDILSIHLPNCEQNVIAFLAATELGGTVTPSNPAYTAAELAQQLETARAVAVLSTTSVRETVDAAALQAGVRRVSYVEEPDCFANSLCPDALLPATPIDGARDLVALPFSSGTTGKPKGVMLSHRNLGANVLQSLSHEDLRHDVRAGDRLIGVLPLYHIYGMLILGFSLASRAHLVLLPKFEPLPFLEVAEYDLSALRFIVTGAATLDAGTQVAVSEQLGVPIRQGWGMTEVSQAAFSPLSFPPVPGSSGRALPGTRLKVVDPDTGAPRGVGEKGELCVSGPQVMVGYLDRPDETARTVRDGWVHTGDLGYVDGEENVFITGRVKELIKVKGMQVAPAEVEGRILEHPDVSDACVVGVPDERAGELPKAFVVRRTGATGLDEQAVKAHVAERLASFKVPAMVEFIDTVPKSPSGKILRRLLA